jgi:hypothetical protein
MILDSAIALLDSDDLDTMESSTTMHGQQLSQ